MAERGAEERGTAARWRSGAHRRRSGSPPLRAHSPPLPHRCRLSRHTPPRHLLPHAAHPRRWRSMCCHRRTAWSSTEEMEVRASPPSPSSVDLLLVRRKSTVVSQDQEEELEKQSPPSIWFCLSVWCDLPMILLQMRLLEAEAKKCVSATDQWLAMYPDSSKLWMNL